MKTFVKLSCVIVLLATVHSDREVVEVQVDTYALDLSQTDLTTSYCQIKDSQCPGENLAPGQFAATTMQCTALCSRNLQCLSAFYTNDKTCYLRGGRCDMSQLKSSVGGVDLYRLKKKESCPTDRPLFVASAVSYSNKFCLWRGKACPGHNLYPKPQNTFPNLECLKKCARINTCPGVDYYSKVPNCEPKDYACPDAELIDSPGTINYIRLQEGVSQCPSNRVAGESIPATVQTPVPAPEPVAPQQPPVPAPEPEQSPVPAPEPEPSPLPAAEPAQPPAPAPGPEQPLASASEPEEPPAPAPEPELPPVPAPEQDEPPVPAPEPEEPPVPAPEPEEPPVPAPEPVEPPIPATEPEQPSIPATEPEQPSIPATEPEQPPVPGPEQELSPVPTPATCLFYQELQQLMAKYPDGCASCP